jgi:hypothetical protein
MQMNKGGLVLIALFMAGGIFFWVTEPQIGLGQIWVAMASFVLIVYLIVGIRSRLREGSMPSGFPANTGQGPQVNTPTMASMATVAGQYSDAGQAVLEALRQNGIDPTKSGTIDLTQATAARDAVLKALSDHGIDVAHQIAMASPAIPIAPTQEPVERMSKLKQLHDTGLITDAEFESGRKMILRGL